MKRLALVLALLAAFVLASTGGVLAQNTTPGSKQGNTHKHANTQQSTTSDNQQQDSSNDAPSVGKGIKAKTASSGASPQAVNNCGIDQGTLTGYNVYGAYTDDPSSGGSNQAGGNNHAFVFGYFVPQPPLNTAFANFYVCRYDTNTGKETFTGVQVPSDIDRGYGKSFIDPPPSGNAYAIHDGLLPPLGNLLGKGIYSVYEILNPTSTGDYLTSQPHYIQVT